MTAAADLGLAAAQEALRRDGWCVVPGVLDAEQVAHGKDLLWRAAEQQQAAGANSSPIDPNDRNVRVYMLPAVDQFFMDLLTHPTAMAIVASLLDTPALVSNFTANIALPGSGSMRLHSDQALVVPAPWLAPWALNIIWCLDDVGEANGATRYLPGSQRFSGFEDVPADAVENTVAFTAPAGSVIAMDGRMWHTSGANTTENDERAMAFAYYTADFLRPQINWHAALPKPTVDALTPQTSQLFGLGYQGNTRMGAALTRLDADV